MAEVTYFEQFHFQILLKKIVESIRIETKAKSPKVEQNAVHKQQEKDFLDNLFR